MHVDKYSRGALGHMLGHYDRTKEVADNVDRSRTHLNWNAAADDQKMSQIEFVRQRLEELKGKRAIRKDANIICDWALTVPKDLPENLHRLFFNSAYRFLAEKYGKHNVVSAYVHCDEKTPHMHFAWIPAVIDKKTQKEKLCAKECVTQKDLKTIHTELQQHLERELGCPVNVLTGELSNRPNLTLEQYKALRETEENLSELQQCFEQMQKTVEAIEQQLLSVNARYEAQKTYVDSFEKLQSAINDGVTEHHSIFKGDTVEMTKEKYESEYVCYADKIATAEMREKTEQLLAMIENTNMAQKYYDMVSRYMKLRDHSADVERGLQRTSEELKRIQNIIKLNPRLKSLFVATESAINERQAHVLERDEELCL